MLKGFKSLEDFVNLTVLAVLSTFLWLIFIKSIHGVEKTYDLMLYALFVVYKLIDQHFEDLGVDLLPLAFRSITNSLG